MFLGKEKLKIKSCTYYLCIARNRSIVVWLVWFQRGSALGASIAVQALGTTTVAAAAAGMAWVFLDKILGHKLMGSLYWYCSRISSYITPAAGFVSIPHAYSLVYLVVL
jgi:Amt family ammonium transporter